MALIRFHFGMQKRGRSPWHFGDCFLLSKFINWCIPTINYLPGVEWIKIFFLMMPSLLIELPPSSLSNLSRCFRFWLQYPFIIIIILCYQSMAGNRNIKPFRGILLCPKGAGYDQFFSQFLRINPFLLPVSIQ